MLVYQRVFYMGNTINQWIFRRQWGKQHETTIFSIEAPGFCRLGPVVLVRLDQNHVSPSGYGSIPINTIFSGMNIHLPAILMFTRGTRFWHTATSHPSDRRRRMPSAWSAAKASACSAKPCGWMPRRGCQCPKRVRRRIGGVQGLKPGNLVETWLIMVNIWASHMSIMVNNRSIMVNIWLIMGYIYNNDGYTLWLCQNNYWTWPSRNSVFSHCFHGDVP